MVNYVCWALESESEVIAEERVSVLLTKCIVFSCYC